MKVYSQLEKAQLENVTANPVQGVTGRVVVNTTTNEAVYDDGVAIREVVNKNKAQTIVAKTFDDEITAKEIATPATPASGYSKIYPKSDGKWYFKDDAGFEDQLGAGGGDTNYVDNGRFEAPLTGWVNSNAGFALTRTTTDPLREIASGLITKDAADRNGETIQSATFSIDLADRANIVLLTFDCETSANYVTDYVGVRLYDVTNSAYLPETKYIAANALANKVTFDFQTSATGVDYKLEFFCNTTTTTAWTMKIDNVKLGENLPIVNGLAGWKQYDVSAKISGTGISAINLATAIPYKTLDGEWRLKANISTSRTPSGAQTTQAITFADISLGVAQTAAANATDGSANYATSGVVGAAGSMTFAHASANTTTYRISFDVRLSEKPTWAEDYSNVELSNTYSNRDIVTTVGKTAGQAFTLDGNGDAIATKIILPNVVTDTVKAWDAVNSRYVTPEDGFYDMSGVQGGFAATTVFPTGATVLLRIYVNGSNIKQGAAILPYVSAGAQSVYSVEVNLIGYPLKKGDLVEFYIQPGGDAKIKTTATTAIADEAFRCKYTIAKSSQASSTFGRQPKVVEIWNTSSQTFVDGTVVIFTNKVESTHGAYDTATGFFTAPRDGVLKIASSVRATNAAHTVGNLFGIYVRRTGSATTEMYGARYPIVTTASIEASASIPVNLTVIKGDLVYVRINTNLSGTKQLSGAASTNHVSFIMED